MPHRSIQFRRSKHPRHRTARRGQEPCRNRSCSIRTSSSTAGSPTSAEAVSSRAFGGIEQVPIGENAARVAAVRSKALDGCIVDIASALNYVQRGDGRILLRFNDLVKDFILHVIFATDKAIAQKPEALRGRRLSARHRR